MEEKLGSQDDGDFRLDAALSACQAQQVPGWLVGVQGCYRLLCAHSLPQTIQRVHVAAQQQQQPSIEAHI